MSRKTMTEGPEEVVSPAPDIEPVSTPMPSPAESFVAWWDATIPDSAVSRKTSVFNRAYALRKQLLSVLSEA